VTDTDVAATPGTRIWRVFAWTVVGATAAFILNNYLNYWQGWPGAGAVFAAADGDGGDGSGTSMLAFLQLGFYVAALALAAFAVMRRPSLGLRAEAARINALTVFLIRFAFWSVFLVGLGDIIVSFLRVEEMLGAVLGEETASAWGYNETRGPELHLPLIGVGFVLALFTRTLGFHWLALLVVLAELLIVITRFVFSYEQAFQGDLVRFWYGALFLFASAYTLYDDGHVRVDVVYSGMSQPTQGFVNMLGCLIMGILFCWVILVMGMDGPSSVINAPIRSLEITQAGFGMYVKYLMAAFLGVFATTMMFQFSSYLLDSVADWRGDPGGRHHHVHGEDHETEVV